MHVTICTGQCPRKRAVPPRSRRALKEKEPLAPMDPSLLQAFIPIAGLIAIGFAIFLARDVLSRDTGPKEMMEVSATINEGAVAFIKRQYTTIGLLAIAGSVVIFAIISALETTSTADT